MKGLTLLEALIATFVLGLGVAALIGSLSVISKGSSDAENVNIAAFLARDLMEEILQKGFADPDGGATFGAEEAQRLDYDDVDDFDGLSESPPKDASGTAYDGAGTTPDYSRFTRSCVVENVPENSFDVATPSADGSTDAKRIIVTVSWKETGGTPQVQLKSVATEYHPGPR